MNAIWNPYEETYLTENGEWESADGIEWFVAGSNFETLVDTPEFYESTIHFVGGPREGDDIAA